MQSLQEIVIPGNVVDDVNEALIEGLVLPVIAETVEFENGFSARVHTVATSVVVTLSNQDGEEQGTESCTQSPIDREYSIDAGNDTYVVVLSRGAADELSGEAADKYVTDNNGNSCPLCGCDDIHAGAAKYGTRERSMLHVNVSCLHCNAQWVDTYELAGLVVTVLPGTEEVEVVTEETAEEAVTPAPVEPPPAAEDEYEDADEDADEDSDEAETPATDPLLDDPDLYDETDRIGAPDDEYEDYDGP